MLWAEPSKAGGLKPLHSTSFFARRAPLGPCQRRSVKFTVGLLFEGPGIISPEAGVLQDTQRLPAPPRSPIVPTPALLITRLRSQQAPKGEVQSVTHEEEVAMLQKSCMVFPTYAGRNLENTCAIQVAGI